MLQATSSSSLCKQQLSTIELLHQLAPSGCHRTTIPTPEKRPVDDVIKLLKQDHREVKKMLDELEDTTERATTKRKDVFARVQSELRLHELVEEEIVYPAFREKSKLKDIVLEGYEEHHVVDLIMNEVAGEPVTDETWGAKLKVMKENVEHHIEEEEGKMFPQARKLFSEEELEDLGRRITARKEQEKSQLPRAA